MNKYETLKKRYESKTDLKNKLQNELEKLYAERDAAEAAAKEQAEAGHVDEFLENKKKAERIEAQIFVKQSQIRKAEEPISQIEIREAWMDYIKPVNKEFERRKNDFIQARQNLLDSFRKMMQCQEDAFAVREQCAVFSGEELKPEAFPMDLIEANYVGNDRTLFARLKMYSPEEDIHYGHLLLSHHT